MRILQEIHFKHKGREQIIYFGEPTEEQELEKMFKLRFQVYSEHGYIDVKKYPGMIEKDKYDLSKKCYYLIAKINNDVVGSIRLIRDYYLPTEKECFYFKEPEEIKKIPRDKRIELSRLVAKPHKINNNFIPRHLVLLGLISSALKITERENIEGGYAFIKDSLSRKLRKIGIPFHLIEPHIQIYKAGPLYNYFHQPTDPVFPIYFLKHEVRDFLKKIFENKLIFEMFNKDTYYFKGVNAIKLFFNKLLHLLNN